VASIPAVSLSKMEVSKKFREGFDASFAATAGDLQRSYGTILGNLRKCSYALVDGASYCSLVKSLIGS